MTINGVINIGGVIAFPMPTGMELMIAEDGSRHVVVKAGGGDFCQIAHCESLTANVTSISNATFRTDIAAELGLVDGGSGGEIITAKVRYGIPGTAFFIILGESFSASLGQYEVYGIRYAIVSPGVTRIDGHYHYRDDSTEGFLDGGGWGGALGIAVDGDDMVAIDGHGNGFVNFRVNLVRLPLTGNIISTIVPNSWSGCLSVMPSPNMVATTGWWDRGSGDAGNWATVVPFGSNVGVFNYQQFENSQPSEFIGCLLGNPETDFAPLFGIPFPDEGFDFAGAPSTDDYDYYTNPIVTDLLDGRFEWKFIRRFSDNEDWIGVHTFLTNDDLSEIVDLGYERFFGSADLSNQGEAMHVYRDDDDLIFMDRENAALIFFTISSPVPDDVDTVCGVEDEDDEIQTVLLWPKCDLVPADIDVQMISPSISPGRALSGREQIVKGEAGYWRIELMGIKVYTRAALFLWRELESNLDGRNTPILIPFYDAPLSSSPIAATPDADYAIGIVRIGIEQTAGASIRAGMHFSAGEQGYVIRRVFGTVAGVTSVIIWPPLRRAITDATVLDFNDPVVRCRLERDDGMNIMLEHLKFALPSAAFVEDV